MKEPKPRPKTRPVSTVSLPRAPIRGCFPIPTAWVKKSPGFSEMFGYTEPFRRFVQHETFSPQANEIRNTAASWLPGDDYYTNFHNGDPFIKIDDGYARLPGAGYAALHPELKDIDPEDYPDIHKMSILADVAP